jgi:hypothetical protein
MSNRRKEVKEMPQMMSPNAMLEEAKNLMLEGREPETPRDWAILMNCLAANISPEVAQPACRLIARLYSMPLTTPEVDEIVAFQLARR